MTQTFVRIAIIGTTFALAIPLSAQRGPGAGVGHAAGSVTGAATGAANGAANVNPGAGNHDNGNHGANAGGGVGASGDVSLRVSQNPGLSTQLQPLLPAGATLSGAAAGFRNQGQFISALHVAHNLNIPFDQLKAKMTGKDPVSLGKAIQELRPALNDKAVKDNTKLADRQAERDLEQSESSGRPGPFISRITSNTALSSRLQALLPQGTTLQTAAAGFKNEGQFIAALEASKNLNISFADLKDRITAGQSLGQAIQALSPKLTEQASDNAAIQAEQQAKDLRAGVSASGAASSRP
ncbi:MAG TPA: hypothetical protein VGQ49_14110 [Bryobacteraceae bacterium]|jgi:hypothetical protein|nr:hypothetical protein [Bryobacteraceae bacterium]